MQLKYVYLYVNKYVIYNHTIQLSILCKCLFYILSTIVALILLFCRSSLNFLLLLSSGIFLSLVSPQCRPASVVQRVSQRVQQQPVVASLLHPASVQPAPCSTYALLLSPPIQHQLQDDGAQWLDPRQGPGARGGGTQAARIHCAEEGPGGLGVWADESSQSHSLPGQRSRCSEATVAEKRGEWRKEAEGGRKEERAEGQELGEGFPCLFLFMIFGRHDRSPSLTAISNLYSKLLKLECTYALNCKRFTH